MASRHIRHTRRVQVRLEDGEHRVFHQRRERLELLARLQSLQVDVRGGRTEPLEIELRLVPLGVELETDVEPGRWCAGRSSAGASTENRNLEPAFSSRPASGWKKSALRPTSCTGQPALVAASSSRLAVGVQRGQHHVVNHVGAADRLLVGVRLGVVDLLHLDRGDVAVLGQPGQHFGRSVPTSRAPARQPRCPATTGRDRARRSAIRWR